MARYIRRYTSDLHVIAASDTLADLTRPDRDYKVHVWDTLTRTVAWQNTPSMRYGDAGVQKEGKV